MLGVPPLTVTSQAAPSRRTATGADTAPVTATVPGSPSASASLLSRVRDQPLWLQLVATVLLLLSLALPSAASRR